MNASAMIRGRAGKYGGYLEFEIQDTSYRVTRYFGKTAAKDTFSLLDLTSRRPSEAYSEKLGEELFRLDADSFARSTYVPQLSASDVGATTSIRTKLSNLVEDTNDLSNYDTAEKKLRDYRTKFRAYRGNGELSMNYKMNTLLLKTRRIKLTEKAATAGYCKKNRTIEGRKNRPSGDRKRLA